MPGEFDGGCERKKGRVPFPGFQIRISSGKQRRAMHLYTYWLLFRSYDLTFNAPFMRQLAFAVDGAIKYKTGREERGQNWPWLIRAVSLAPITMHLFPRRERIATIRREREQSSVKPTFSQKIMESQSNFGSMSLVKKRRRRRGEMFSPRIASM